MMTFFNQNKNDESESATICKQISIFKNKQQNNMPGYINPRLRTEFAKLYNAKLKVKINNDKANELEVIIKGPADSAYRDGVFKLIIKIPAEFPFKSPSVGFGNRIYHPNIDEKSGSICLDVLNQYWSPMYDCTNVVNDFIPLLLMYPNATDPLNAEAATDFIKSKEYFEDVVKKHCLAYSYQEKVEVKANNNTTESDSEDLLEI